ncbi:MAG: TIGR00730 family Rossman fold protein [Hyphomicrobiales bacterium]|nr:MAG: TIGR00730 family Rossman fold protein [Hyphomicrobiales bacterium]
MGQIRSICVYCGSRTGENPLYVHTANELGRQMAANDIRLIYGGGSIGLMGTVAKSVLANGGQVTGIIPEFLSTREIMLDDVSELIVTTDMHERKRTMFERAEAFVALPGGVGTLEEVVEMMTWAQLGQHKKPVLLANVAGFWNPLIDLLAHMRSESFIGEPYMVSYLVVDHVEDIVPRLAEAVKDTAQAALDIAADAEAIKRL